MQHTHSKDYVSFRPAATANALVRFCFVFAAICAVLSPCRAIAGDGAIDDSFAADIQPSSSDQRSTAFGAVPLPDGKLLVYGVFATVSGVSQVDIARLNADGSIDASFAPVLSGGGVVGGIVYCSYVQPDGKILIGGSFDSVNGTTARGLVRLNSDGTVDPSFSWPGLGDASASNGSVFGILVQLDGKILVHGTFAMIGGVERRSCVRLNSDGSLDTSFAPSFTIAADPSRNATVYSMALQPDGKILAVGNFTLANGVSRLRMARLNSDGTLDPLQVDLDNAGRCVVLQRDGSAVVAGGFSTVRGQSRTGIFRLLSDGSIDTSFAQPPVTDFESIVLQTDGRITGVGNAAKAVLRLNADGTQDSSWTAGATGNDNSIIQQGDGKILLGRESAMPQLDTPWWPLVRLLNSPTTHALTITSNRVGYFRTGPVPELESTLFQFSADGGATWTDLGAGNRIAGDSSNWELPGLSLPAGGIVRVLERPVNAGFYQGRGLTSYQRPYNLAQSLLTLEDAAGTSIANNTSYNCGSLSLNQSRDLTFTVRNYGDPSLNLSLSITGPDAPLFTIVTPPAAQLAGPDGSTTFTVRFQPTLAGAKSATLNLTSNSATNSPFTLTLNGIGEADGEVTYFYDKADMSTLGLAPQPDGQLVVVGNFSNIGPRARSGIVRFRADGTTDKTFNPGANDLVIQCGTLPDGKVIVAGGFTSIGGVARSKVARLNADGTVDTSFVPPTLDNDVWSIALQPDGKLLVGGQFTQVGGAPSNPLIRLNTDGSLDPGFTAPAFDSMVTSISVLPTGKILAGSYSQSTTVVRLNSDGTIDPTFQTTNAAVLTGMVIQPDGDIVICGNFTSVNGQSRQHLARLTADGVLDDTFIQPVDLLPQGGLALQADGRMLITGFFNTPRPRLARLNPDASVDNSLVADLVGNYGYGIALGSKGEIFLNGFFQSINGVAPADGGNVTTVQLHNTIGSSVASVTSPSRVQWLRNGTVGELIWARFDVSTDGGATWSPLGVGSRIPGGWELTGLNLPTTGLVRAVGTVIAGHQDGGFSSVVETTAFDFTPPATPTPSPTATATPTATPTAIPTATPVSTPSPTATATPTASPTATPTPSATATPTPIPAAQPLNISTRMEVLTGDNVLIAGFIVTGQPNTTKTVMIRGLGPSLAAQGVANALSDPLLELHGPGNFATTINDNWNDLPDTSQIPQGFAPSDTRESVIIAQLSVSDTGFANYTAILRGAHGESGVGLVEAYDLSAGASRFANISTRGFVDTGDNVMIGGFILGGSSGSSQVLVRAIGPSLPVANALPDPTLAIFSANGERVAYNDNWKTDALTGESQETAIRATLIPPDNDAESAILKTFAPGAYTAIVSGNGGGTGVGLVEVYHVRPAGSSH